MLDKSNILLIIDDYDFIDIFYMFHIYSLDCDNSNYREKL